MPINWDSFGDPAPNERDPEQPILFNFESLGNNPAEVIFVDTEEDVLALIECDIVNGVAFLGEITADVFRPYFDVLKKAKRIVLAGGMDKAAMDRREALAGRVGRNKCHLVTWPAGLLNASDVFQKRGTKAVQVALQAAEPYPIDGLYRISAARLLALRARPSPPTMTTGTVATDTILKLPAEGRLIVVTGFPAGGKTSWLRYVMVHTARNHDRRWAVFSPEMMPWEQFCADCAEVWSGKPFWPERDKPDKEPMSEYEIAEAGRWLEKRLTMIVCDSEDQAPTMPWLLGMAADAVLRDGVTDILLDPWNEIEQARERNVTETDYIGRSLQQWKAFIQRHGVNIWIIAHPAKPQGFKVGENKPAPGPYDIAASAHWANKPDLGITIHGSELHLWKARFRRFGVKGTMATMVFDPLCGQYSDPPPLPDALDNTYKPYQED